MEAGLTDEVQEVEAESFHIFLCVFKANDPAGDQPKGKSRVQKDKEQGGEKAPHQMHGIWKEPTMQQ